MIDTDEHNLRLAKDLYSVDELNRRFYGRFPFPWSPAALERVGDPTLEAKLMNQSIGLWDRCEIPADGRIWVAGCGTNQAVTTALKFPHAHITATDLSSPSLEIGVTNAGLMGLTNIDFRRQSINEATYAQEYDYIICTGVIHHNADPGPPLARLRAALKRRGVCELMVYNRFHRVWRAPCKGTVFQWVRIPPGICRSSR